MDPSRPRILLVAGGTGGHIYPALALGEALRALRPDVDLRHCCGARPGEIAIYKSRGIEPPDHLWVLPLSGRRRGLASAARFARELAASYWKVRRLVRAFRPDLAIGFGNYLSVPALVAARAAGARTVIHEQNATPGLANRWLARRAELALAGIPVRPGAFPEGRTRLVGNPVREDLLRPVDRAEARRALGLPAEGPVCLCFGGSLGAVGVNRLLQKTLTEPDGRPLDFSLPICDPSRAVKTAWHFLWAPGRDQCLSVESWLAERPGLKDRVTLLPYIDRMDWAYAAADLVVSRAGALTLAELTALGKPSILVPLPHSAGDHQRDNARTLAQAGAAEILEEADPASPSRLASLLNRWLENADELGEMGRKARALGRPEAAQTMAMAVLELLN